MKLEKYEDQRNKKRKIILISLGVIVLVSVSLVLYKTFASFTESVEFPMMKGKVDYFGNSDIYFVFYKGDEQLDEMPQKGNKENLVFDYGECDNGASIEWNSEEWGPLVKGLNKVKTKCSLYFKEFKMGELRTISSPDTNGMWNYKNKLTKIVIENTKSEKTGNNGQSVYGPYDKSSTGDSAVESYVVCDTGDTNCIGYLQGEGGIKLISGRYLFGNFTNVTEIDGIENLDTSSVTNMSGMFYGLSSIQELDLSHFDTSSVTSMNRMFYGDNKLTKIIYGSNFIHNAEANTGSMFGNGCPANKPDATVHSSWQGVTF